jgi:hypothetical protein
VGTKRKPNYSRGIRQRLHALAQTPEWRDGFGVKIGTREEVPGDYSRGLASSKFCLVAPGMRARAAAMCCSCLAPSVIFACGDFKKLLSNYTAPQLQADQQPALLLPCCGRPVVRLDPR